MYPVKSVRVFAAICCYLRFLEKRIQVNTYFKISVVDMIIILQTEVIF